jgi:hypothetical protein
MGVGRILRSFPVMETCFPILASKLSCRDGGRGSERLMGEGRGSV